MLSPSHSPTTIAFPYIQLVIQTLPAANVPHPPPLEEGMEESVYLAHVATPPSSPKSEADKETSEATGVADDGDGAAADEEAEKTPGRYMCYLGDVPLLNWNAIFEFRKHLECIPFDTTICYLVVLCGGMQ